MVGNRHNRRSSVGAGAAVALILCGNVAEARSVVLRATGPSAGQFRSGQILREPLKLELVAGDRLILIDDQGTRDLRGPAKIDDTAPRRVAQMRMPKWEDLVGSRMRPQTGGMRGRKAVKTPAVRPSTSQDRLWSVDVAVPGNWCTLDPAEIGLWRADAATTSELGISADGSSATVSWAAGQAEAPWPASLPARDNGAYTLQVGSSAPTTVTLHRVSGGSTAELARGLATKGCYQQLAILLES